MGSAAMRPSDFQSDLQAQIDIDARSVVSAQHHELLYEVFPPPPDWVVKMKWSKGRFVVTFSDGHTYTEMRDV